MVKTDIWLMGLAALFTASKSENHPLPLDHFIGAVSMCPLTYKHLKDHSEVVDACKSQRTVGQSACPESQNAVIICWFELLFRTRRRPLLH